VRRDEIQDSRQALSISGLDSRILVYNEVTVVVWDIANVNIGVSVLTFPLF
jgi:hypothetical protein